MSVPTLAWRQQSSRCALQADVSNRSVSSEREGVGNNPCCPRCRLQKWSEPARGDFCMEVVMPPTSHVRATDAQVHCQWAVMSRSSSIGLADRRPVLLSTVRIGFEPSGYRDSARIRARGFVDLRARSSRDCRLLAQRLHARRPHAHCAVRCGRFTRHWMHRDLSRMERHARSNRHAPAIAGGSSMPCQHADVTELRIPDGCSRPVPCSQCRAAKGRTGET